VSVVQGSINITDADQFGIFTACAGLFAPPLGPVQYLWERACPRRGPHGTPELLPYPETNSYPAVPVEPLPFKIQITHSHCVAQGRCQAQTDMAAGLPGPCAAQRRECGACSPVHCCQSIEGWIGQECQGLSPLGRRMALNGCWGIRGLARSHRVHHKPDDCSFPPLQGPPQAENCGVPVGAGMPAKGPGQADAATCVGRLTCGCEALAAAPSSIAC